MKSYDELKALIEKRGVHAEFGDAGEGWGIEQNPHELASFLVRMQELGVTSCLEIGTGYKGGLSRFLAHDMGWQVTSVDINAYHHVFEGVRYIVINEHPKYGASQFFIEFSLSNRFDLVFIDGDHKYESVLNDFTQTSIMANKVIAFHDIRGYRDCDGVRVFWSQMVDGGFGAAAKAVVHSKDRIAAGIGWIEL